MKRYFITLLISGFAVSANASFLSDTFTYPDGSLVGASGSPWTTSSGTAGQQNVVSGELFLNDNETEDTRATFSTQLTTGIIYASFKLRIDTNDVPTNAAGDYIAHFFGDSDLIGASTVQIGRLFTSAPTVASPGAFRLGVSNSAAGASAVYFIGNFTSGTNYDVTLAYNFGTSTASLSVAGFGTVIATDTAASIVRIDVGIPADDHHWRSIHR